MTDLTDVQIQLWRYGLIAMFVFSFMYGTFILIFMYVTRNTRPTWASLPNPPPDDGARYTKIFDRPGEPPPAPKPPSAPPEPKHAAGTQYLDKSLEE